jgi:hypothetical protein
VLEETSRGDLRLVEIQVKVEICRVLTCFHKSYGGPPILLICVCFSHACHFISHFSAFLEAFSPALVELKTFTLLLKNEGSNF